MKRFLLRLKYAYWALRPHPHTMENEEYLGPGWRYAGAYRVRCKLCGREYEVLAG